MKNSKNRLDAKVERTLRLVLAYGINQSTSVIALDAFITTASSSPFSYTSNQLTSVFIVKPDPVVYPELQDL
jgi:hypothetical protein